MKVLVDVKDLTDDAVADLWAMHKFLKREAPREVFVEDTDYAQVSAFAASVKAEAKLDGADVPTQEDVRAALRQVSSKIGTGRVMAIVQQHEATSVSKLDPKHYSSVVAACEAALAEA
jgi:hypothetical protein